MMAIAAAVVAGGEAFTAVIGPGEWGLWAGIGGVSIGV
jgi:hypothetical protein